MEKINENFNQLEDALKQKINVDFLKNFLNTIESSDALMKEISERKKKAASEVKEDAGSRLEEFEQYFSKIIDDVNEKFTGLIGVTKKLETEKSLKEFLIGTLGTIFDNILDETASQFNMTTYNIFKDVMSGLKEKMETEILEKIDTELFNIKDGFKKFQNISEIMEDQFSSIQETISSIKQQYQNQLDAIKKENEIAEEIFPKMNELFMNLTTDFETIQAELGNRISTIQQTPADLLKILRDELNAYDEKKNNELKMVTQFLEKSPKYQLLYLINNLEETSLSKIKELTKFDEGIINLSLEDLKQRDIITTSGEGDELTIKIKQKLNPLSCIELTSVFDNEQINNFKHYSDMASFERGFNQILSQVEKYKETHREEAGYLISILYLYIYESRNYHFFNKIQPSYNDLRKYSFYLRLVENAINTNPWESKKRADLEGIIDPIKVNIITEDIKIDPGAAPLQIEKYRALSILNWDEEIRVEKTDLNKFSTVADLVRWVWLNGKGSNFKIEFKDSKNNLYEIVTSTSEKIDAQLFIKKIEVIAD